MKHQTSEITQRWWGERPREPSCAQSAHEVLADCQVRPTNAWFAFVPLLLNGCSRAPAFDIVGSQFPAWMFCGLTGILFAALSRLLLLRLKIAIVFPVLVYPSLAAFFTFLLWLVFFG